MQQPWKYSRKKFPRKIFDPVRVGNTFRIRFNNEFFELLDNMDIGQRINIRRLLWVDLEQNKILQRKKYLMQQFAEFDINDLLVYYRDAWKGALR